MYAAVRKSYLEVKYVKFINLNWDKIINKQKPIAFIIAYEQALLGVGAEGGNPKRACSQATFISTQLFRQSYVLLQRWKYFTVMQIMPLAFSCYSGTDIQFFRVNCLKVLCVLCERQHQLCKRIPRTLQICFGGGGQGRGGGGKGCIRTCDGIRRREREALGARETSI